MDTVPDRLFNRNMGCIEIGQDLETLNRRGGFNRNMGCIEIYVPMECCSMTNPFNRNMGCIEIDMGAIIEISLSV